MVDRRTTPGRAPVAARKPHPDVWSLALTLAEGNDRRLEVVDSPRSVDGLAVLVLNNPAARRKRTSP